jgi:K+-transporting ATPase ATPase C chain
MQSLITSLRVAATSIAVCVVGYVAVILGVAQVFTPHTANGSLIISAEGRIVGSRLIAQKFTDPRYFWPRPSAVDYNGAGAGGSNKSPTSTALTERAQSLIEQYGATAEHPVPPELVAASGGGLDPHISEPAARYQAARVAAARAVPQPQIEALIQRHAFAPGGPLAGRRIVNVLELNLALDTLAPHASR